MNKDYENSKKDPMHNPQNPQKPGIPGQQQPGKLDPNKQQNPIKKDEWGKGDKSGSRGGAGSGRL